MECSDDISAKRSSSITHPRKSALRSASSVCLCCFPTRKSFGTKVSIFLCGSRLNIVSPTLLTRRTAAAPRPSPVFLLAAYTRSRSVHVSRFTFIATSANCFHSHIYFCCAIFVNGSANCFICKSKLYFVISFPNFNLGLVTGNVRSNSYCVIIFSCSAFNECILQYLVSD